MVPSEGVIPHMKQQLQRFLRFLLSKLQQNVAPMDEQGFPIPEMTPERALVTHGLPFPFVVIEDKRIVSAAGMLQPHFENGGLQKITDIVPMFDYAVSKQTATYGGKSYVLFSKSFELEKSGETRTLIAVYFIENNSALSGSENLIAKMAVSLIFIDNYDEVLHELEEVRRPLLIALIDRKINAMAQQADAIIRKFEKDKYLFIFTQDKLEYFKEKKFDILTQIREIDMGNKIPFTLSIGIGTGSETLAQAMEYARSAIDLALGRGGDQALIREGDKYIFFGGHAQEVSSNARVRARVKAYAFSELLLESDNVIVLGHKNIDLDCLGSAVGVHKIVTAMGRECHIVLGNVTSSIRFLHERLLAEKGCSENVFISAAQALEHIGPRSLIVIVDTHRPSIIEGNELLAHPSAKRVVLFDHHRKATESVDNPVLAYHEPYASSTSELITEMIQYIKADVRLRPVEADALLAGITVDTKNFSIKTGAKTFEAAAYLRRNGADSVRVKLLFQSDIASFKAKAETVSNAEIYLDNIAIAVSTSDVENPTLLAAQTSDELLNIHGIQASFVLCANDGVIYISARSLGSLNVQVIVEKLGGGGHQTVAGAQIRGKSIDETEEALKQVIDEYLNEAGK